MSRVGPSGEERLEVDVLSADRVTLVRVAGSLDAATSTALVATLHDRLGDGSTDVVLDVGNLELCDSAGLHALVAFRRRQPDGGSFTLARARPGFVRLLEATGVGSIFEVAGEPVDRGDDDGHDESGVLTR